MIHLNLLCLFIIKLEKKGFIESGELGSQLISGVISLLHIDGNHSYQFVKRDIELWFPLVIKGGWILLDDYLWAFGDGPKIAGDELLSSGKIDCAFIIGDTLFLRKF